VPNAKIDKEPIIQRSDVGGAAAYVRVLAKIVVKDKSDAEVSSLTVAQKKFILRILQEGKPEENWKFVPSTVDNDGYTDTAYYYYVETSNILKPLYAPASAGTTQTVNPIFKGLTIPNLTGAELKVWTGDLTAQPAVESMEEWSINVELTAELIQAANNPKYDGTGSDATNATGWALAFQNT
jgi:hypothetical protein